MTPDKPREVAIHQSANRPNQILGGDRELVLVAMLVAISLSFSLASLWGVALSIGFWVSSVAIFQRMGKGPDDAPDLYAAHPLPNVLPGEERLVLDVSANAGQVEMNRCARAPHPRTEILKGG